MFKIAICDDSKDFVDQTLCLLENYEYTKYNYVCQSFDNGDALIAAHRHSPFDIILLDVIMPMLNGIETARIIRKNDKNVKIVFLTSSPEYAVDSYTVKANNYLLKPLDSSAFFQCLNELVSEITRSTKTLTIKELHSVRKIPLDSIAFVEAQNKHTIFTLVDGSFLKTTEPMRTYENQLHVADGFFRCHRSYIINLCQVSSYASKEITMHSGMRIPVSRSCHKEFESTYFSIIFGKAGESND